LIHIGEGNNNFGARVLRNSAQIVLFNSADSDYTSLNEVLKSEIIDTSAAKNNSGTSIDD